MGGASGGPDQQRQVFDVPVLGPGLFRTQVPPRLQSQLREGAAAAGKHPEL